MWCRLSFCARRRCPLFPICDHLRVAFSLLVLYHSCHMGSTFFEITHKEKHTRARTGVIHTDHGDIHTPVFMPVGTQATVKTLDVNDLQTIGPEIILANTYHLPLRPGEDLVSEWGGLHSFMGWDKPILTDSGGFQVFSLANKTAKPVGVEDINSEHSNLVKIDEDGVTFKSYIDGSTHRFTPEVALDIQHKLGADIIMAFDECTPDTAPHDYAQQALERTHRWAKRSLDAHQELNAKSPKDYRQFLFGIIQGGQHKELREESARSISSLDFDGIAIGGESGGYNMPTTKKILNWVHPLIPEDKPHYTMGVGHSPLDIFDVVEYGVDMFDCVSPTRMARNGSLYISPETARQFVSNSTPFSQETRTLTITRSQFRNDTAAVDPTCACFTCTHHSRAYLHHLFRAEEMLAYRLATIHNVHFLTELLRDVRVAIESDSFLELKHRWSTI